MRRLFLVSLLLISGLFFTFSLASLSRQSAEAGSNPAHPVNPSFSLSPSSLVSLSSPIFPSLRVKQAPTSGQALSRRAPSINGRLEGSIQQLTPENVTLNGGATITEKLYVPGTPTVRRNGNPNFGGVIEGSGSAIPTNYQVTLNGNATLGNLVNRTNPFALTPVAAPPTPTGTRDVSLNNPNDQIGDFATLRNLTLNGNAGTRSVPPGIYGNFTVNGSSVLIFGVANAVEPAAYNLQGLTLNGGTQLQIVGPVTLTLRNGTNINGTIGNAANPLWLTLNVSNGGVTLNGGSQMFGKVNAPAGSVTVNSRLTGNVICDRLTVNGGGVVTILAQAPQDTTAPVITITEPAQGLITKLSPITVSGTVTDTSAVTVTVNGQPINLSGTQFSTAVTLAEGSNTITVLATDTFGNVGTGSRNITLDTTAPVLTITSPQDGSTTTEAQLTITGTVTDATTTTVTVNNVAAVRNGNEFSALVSLVEGSNTFIIRAEDAAGNQTQSTQTVTLQVPHDTTPPVINLTEPTEGLITNVSPVTVSGIVTDASAVTVTVNNQLATLSGTQFTASVVLTEGSNTIAVSATDAFGNASSASRTVVLDTTAPVLTITSPEDGAATTEPQLTVTGTVTDATTISVTVNDIAATLTGPEFSAVVPLVEGPNTLLVRAVDASGNQTEASKTVLKNLPLTINLNQPTDGQFLNKNLVEVTGQLTGNWAALTINGVPIPVHVEGYFSSELTLADGTQVIEIIAMDSQGHQQRITRQVTIDTIPPILSNLTPLEGTIISSPTTTIQGQVSDATAIEVYILGSTQQVAPNQAGLPFSINDVPVAEGLNSISVFAFDAAGNSTQIRLLLVGKDKTPPEPPVLFPFISPTRLTYQAIQGRTEPGATITITGGGTSSAIQAAFETGLFFTQIDLTSGANLYSFTSSDADGNVSLPTQVTISCDPDMPMPSSGQPSQINGATGTLQRGITEMQLPKPLVAIISDRNGLPVPSTQVTFRVLQGGGSFVGGANQMTVSTNSQGYASTNFVCGSDSGIEIVQADFQGNTLTTSLFMIQTVKSLPEAGTKLAGAVYDQNQRPLPNVLIRLGGQQTRTGADGRFLMENVPTGPHQLLEAIGRDQIPYPGRWPNISYDIDILPGITNRLWRPIFLPRVNDGINLPLDSNNIVTQDTVYELPVVGGEPPIKVTIHAGTQITFAPDTSDRRFSVTRIPLETVPMPLEDGRATRLYVTVQPSGAIFDPPLDIEFPNYDQLAPNSPVLLMSFDHDAGRYVQAGTGKVSEDGKTVSNDPGVGIRVGAWHGFPPAAPQPETNGSGGDGSGGSGCDTSGSRLAKTVTKNGLVSNPNNTNVCYSCDVSFCGSPAIDAGGGVYWARVPSLFAKCLFLALNCRPKPTITGPDVVWWFNGEKPTSYETSIELKVTPANRDQTWFIRKGQDKVKIIDGTGNTNASLYLQSVAMSETEGDVEIVVDMYGETATHLLTVRGPKKLVPYILKSGSHIQYLVEPGMGFRTNIFYQIQDNLGKSLPFDVPQNEYWPGDIIPDNTNSNWERRPANGDITVSDKTKTPPEVGIFYDKLTGPGYDQSPNPQPVAPPKPPEKPNGAEVDHWDQEWYVGSTQPGKGVLVQKNILQRYTDHCSHEEIKSPVTKK